MITTRLTILLLTIICATTVSHVAGQAGLWEVTSVTVGKDTVTPVAKWFNLSEDGTVLSGNGGMINISGTFTYNPETSESLFTDDQGVPDEFGPFKIAFDETTMTWLRNENGMPVKVNLVKVSKIPDGPWDTCIGPWAEDDGSSDELLTMHWDRTFRWNTKQGQRRGIWHIAAHQPTLTLFHQDGTSNRWTIEFPDADSMIWRDEFGAEKVFSRQANW